MVISGGVSLEDFHMLSNFRIEENQIVVFGLFHCARDPRTVKVQLFDRDDLP